MAGRYLNRTRGAFAGSGRRPRGELAGILAAARIGVLEPSAAQTQAYGSDTPTIHVFLLDATGIGDLAEPGRGHADGQTARVCGQSLLGA